MGLLAKSHQSIASKSARGRTQYCRNDTRTSIERRALRALTGVRSVYRRLSLLVQVELTCRPAVVAGSTIIRLVVAIFDGTNRQGALTDTSRVRYCKRLHRRRFAYGTKEDHPVGA